MELGLLPKTSFLGAQFGIKPSLQPIFSKSLYGFVELRRGLSTPCMATSSGDYSRRRPKKRAIPKVKVPPAKGFAPAPKPQKKDQSDIDEKVVSDKTEEAEVDLQSSISSSVVKRRTKILEDSKENNDKTDDKVENNAVSVIPLAASSNDEMRRQPVQYEIGEADKGLKTLEVTRGRAHTSEVDPGTSHLASSSEVKAGLKKEKEATSKRDIDISKSKETLVQMGGHINSSEIDSGTSHLASSSKVKAGVEEEEETKGKSDLDISESKDTLVKKGGHIDSSELDPGTGHLASSSKVKAGVKGEKEAIGKNDVDISESKETLVKKGGLIDSQAKRKLLEDLAEENFVRGNKVFVFPKSVQADKVIEVFLNRSLSTLIDENNVFIKGAFNSWRWKSFTERMQKTGLKGDWWSCHLYVPKEAYRIDFVFFNGENIYENNNSDDFVLRVESGLDIYEFEDFLLEEKRKELERIALEQAEKERQAEEERRREEEKAASEADRAHAKMEVQRKREAVNQVIKLVSELVDNLWHIEPSRFKGGDRVRLYYNRSSSPLEHATEIWIHGGYNNWNEGLTTVERLQRSEKSGGDWWYAEVIVPDRALVLDWAFADGPPRKAEVYDNNNHLDFHTLVPNISEELFWLEEEHRIFRMLQEERKVKEEAARRKAEKTAHMKAEVKEKSMKRFLLSQKNIVYTDPIEVRAGKMVTVFYNPSGTLLSGKPEVWFRCSFNRWTHCNGPLPPQKMEPSDIETHLKTTVKVPMDAYMMDFVFSEREDGGIYDNNNRMDYHIPVLGGIVKEPPMHVVHIAVEMAPIAKVGGLGDVVTSLSRAIQELGHSVDIVFPKYDCMNLSNVKDFHFRQSFFWGGTEIKVWFGKVEGLSVYFLEPQNGMFWVGCVYGRNDGDRFGFFCHAALEFLLQSGTRPDIIHCHDWSSAPVTWLFKEHYCHYGMSNARVIFTIHNLEFGVGHIAKAMAYADKATTVSHTYSKEVSENPAISPHLYKFHGILNGIDPEIWDPYNDNFIPVTFTSENVVEGKIAAKEALQQRLGLRRSSDHPLVGIITRLTVQKGIHLIKHAIWRTLERNGQVVLLGSAPDPRIQNEFVNLAHQLHSSHGDRARLCLTYDEPLSHLIYAGSDFILVPSIFEPCGLTQLVAMRYGAIPVVRKTGGLYDTVFDVDNDKERAQAQGLEPNGFSFAGADAAGVDYALNRAISAWYDGREWFNSLCKRVMEQDWSWNRPALDYMELYHAARK